MTSVQNIYPICVCNAHACRLDSKVCHVVPSRPSQRNFSEVGYGVRLTGFYLVIGHRSKSLRSLNAMRSSGPGGGVSAGTSGACALVECAELWDVVVDTKGAPDDMVPVYQMGM
jgi:hypothetical protein